MATNISGIGIANAIGFNNFKIRGIASLKPIASYRAYDKTNDDADRNVLTDLTGNGHDIQLYNFAFAESSGYGEYATDFNKWDYSGGEMSHNQYKVMITKVNKNDYGCPYINLRKDTAIKFVFKVSGIPSGISCTFGQNIYNKVVINGINDFSDFIAPTNGNCGFRFSTSIDSCNIVIEQIPEHKGALVSDGVDDYGLCENFPILNVDEGFTICAIREHFSADKKKSFRFLSKDYQPTTGGFIFEYNNGLEQNINKLMNFSFGKPVGGKKYVRGFSYMTSISYNGFILNKGDKPSIDNLLYLFGMSNDYFCNVALYALEIYDRDLTDEEIAKVKARMIAEYEEKTGNKYEEETV